MKTQCQYERKKRNSKYWDLNRKCPNFSMDRRQISGCSTLLLSMFTSLLADSVGGTCVSTLFIFLLSVLSFFNVYYVGARA